MTEAAVIEFRPRNPNGSSGRTRAPLGAATRYERLLEIALQGRSWDVVAAELNLQGHSTVNGGAWTAASAKNAWTTHRGLRHDVFRSEAQLLPVLEAGTAGYAWDETLEKFHQTARNVSPTGCRWSTEQMAAIFCEYATTDEKAAREHITARSGTFNAANNRAASENGANPDPDVEHLPHHAHPGTAAPRHPYRVRHARLGSVCGAFVPCQPHGRRLGPRRRRAHIAAAGAAGAVRYLVRVAGAAAMAQLRVLDRPRRPRREPQERTACQLGRSDIRRPREPSAIERPPSLDDN